MAAQGCAPRRLLQLLQLLLLGAGAAGAQWRGEGTSRNLESIFLGRCAEYSSQLQSPAEREKNCTAIWEAFKVVLDKDPCSVLPSDYDLFINLSRHALPRDKSLFWENNHLLVTSFAENGHRLMPLCDVLYGRVGDFLSWCRQKNGSGLDYESCPSSEDCENNPVDSYWKRASIQVVLGEVDHGQHVWTCGHGTERLRRGLLSIFSEPHFPCSQHPASLSLLHKAVTVKGDKIFRSNAGPGIEENIW